MNGAENTYLCSWVPLSGGSGKDAPGLQAKPLTSAPSQLSGLLCALDFTQVQILRSAPNDNRTGKGYKDSSSDTCSLEDEWDSPGFSSTLKKEFRKERDSEEGEEVEPGLSSARCPVSNTGAPRQAGSTSGNPLEFLSTCGGEAAM